jgi:hypothetical protein
VLKRDLVEREIEKISLILKKLLQLVIKQKDSQNFMEAETTAYKGLADLFSVEFDLLMNVNQVELLGRVAKMDFNHLRLIGDVFFELADIEQAKGNIPKYMNLAHKAIAIFDLADKKSKTIDFERYLKVERLERWADNMN